MGEYEVDIYFTLFIQVMAYVTAVKHLSENDLYELSTKREPHCH